MHLGLEPHHQSRKRVRSLHLESRAQPRRLGPAVRAKLSNRGRTCVVLNVISTEQTEKRATAQAAPVKASPVELEPRPSSIPSEAPEKQQGPGGDGPNRPRPQIKWPQQRSFAEVLLDKSLDTVGDVLMHAKRSFEELPTTRAIDLLVRKKDGTFKLKAKKPVVLVLGTGWGAHSLIKVMDTDAFEVVCISPRNHFIFTPMLPSTAVGTVEFRSLLEPIRAANPFATYFEASCDKLDVEKKVAYCTSSVAFEDGHRPVFEIPYDTAVVAVGEQPATFGVPGVEKHCYFMKEIGDCVGLRKRIQEAFELAAMPGTREEDIQRVLHFVVVGGGPTGVEFAGTLNDFVRVDLKNKYPTLMKYVRVTLLQSAQSILTQFAEGLQRRALSNFANSGVSVRTGVRVVEVNQHDISLANGDKIEYGVCVWSTGNAARPLVRDIIQQVPSQQDINKSAPPVAVKLGVDPYMRVVGARDVVALGDCSMLLGNRLPATAQVAAQQGAYVARMVNRGYSLGVGGLDQAPPVKVKDPAILEQAREIHEVNAEAMAEKNQLSELDILSLLNNDSTYTQAPPGAVYYRKPFEFLSLGIMAYVGNDKALTQVEAFDTSLALYGSFAFLLWRSVYITKQVSFRNRVLILFDWLKTRVFGRDISQF
eukprot:jgi/Chrzof1/5501/Cz16g05180.t1